MAKRANNHDYYTAEDYRDLERIYGYSSGFGAPKLPEDYIFDPKKPPAFGCTTFHPPLALSVNEKAVEIYGSSCLDPIVKDADLYISLDSLAPDYEWEHPWENSHKKHVRFFITDGSVPENDRQFKKCLDYTVQTLDEGKKVHVGCIAGHGRTGLFLAAIAQKTIGEQLKNEGISAVDYVRDNYCANAVENLRQALYLNVVHGVAPPIKEAKRMAEFKEFFLEDIGVSFEEVVGKSDFKVTMPTIRAIESKIYARNNPAKSAVYYPPVKKNNTSLDSTATPGKIHTVPAGFTTAQLENKGPAEEKIANNPVMKSFRESLDPEKLAKLQEFKLRRK